MKASKIAKDLLELFGRGGKRWTTHYAARNKYGRPTLIQDEDACSFCLTGGMYRLYRGNYADAARMLYRVLPVSYISLEDFNDSSDWKTIRTWLRRIAKLDKVAAK